MRTHLADLVLAAHFVFVLFVVGGLPLIWIGAAAGWSWIRNFWFRTAHLAAIVFVAAESLVGAMCPLTTWEDMLRGRPTAQGFIARWVHRVIFYDLPAYVFTAAYVLFAAIVAATYYFVRPRPMPRSGRREQVP